MRDLHSAWLRLLDCEAKQAVVFEDLSGSRPVICAVGVSVFVQDAFIRELKAQPFWFAPELTRSLMRGDSPLLSQRELREANSCGGINVLVWEGRIAPRFENNPEVYRKIANSFVETHRGLFCKEVICHQIESVDRLNWNRQTGGMFWDPAARRYSDVLKTAPKEFLSRPHVFGLTREIETQRRLGSWVGGLFEYQPPHICFSPSEQRLLLSALNGATDRELSNEIGISLFTVKKTWRSIYDRAAADSPELIPFHGAADNGDCERGKEKKQHLIAYLRAHPEELRPVSRKLLQRKQAARPHKTVR